MVITYPCRTSGQPRAWFGRTDFTPPLYGWWCVACLERAKRP